MAFAVEEINRNSTLLPGVKLGYHILDSCSRYPWALGGALSLVGGDAYSCILSDSTTHSAYQQSGETKGMMISFLNELEISHLFLICTFNLK